jgi:DNA polymerase III delta prime subunit
MNSSDQMLWTERYRPHRIADCIIPDALKASFQGYVTKGEIPNLLISGTPGTGKTTVARAMCEELETDYIILNGSNTGIDDIRFKVHGFGSSVSLSGGRKVIIVDEADGMTNAAQEMLRASMEELAVNCSFIFTCNRKGKIIDAIHSRCAGIEFKLQAKDKQPMAAAFFKRITTILKNDEKIEFDPQAIAQLITKFFPDFRRVLNELQRYSVGGKIDVGILSAISDAKLDELVSHLKAKDFKSLRKWVGTNADADSAALMRALYDRAGDIWQQSSLPVVIVITGKYLYQAAFVADQEINTAAWLTELMVEAQVA